MIYKIRVWLTIIGDIFKFGTRCVGCGGISSCICQTSNQNRDRIRISYFKRIKLAILGIKEFNENNKR